MNVSLSFTKSTSQSVTGHKIKFGNAAGVYTQEYILQPTDYAGLIGHPVLANLDPALPWFFTAVAFNAGGESDPSNEVTTVAKPEAPTGLSIVTIS